MITVIIKAHSQYPVSRKRIKETVVSKLAKHGLEDKVEVGITFVGDRKMSQLNQQFRQQNKTTDVLSFPLTEEDVSSETVEFVESPDKTLRLGDIVISYPQVRKQAQEENLLVDVVIDRLVQHGLEHLLGIHHD